MSYHIAAEIKASSENRRENERDEQMSLLEMSPVLRELELEGVVSSIREAFSGVNRKPIAQESLVDEAMRLTHRSEADVVLALGRIRFEYYGDGKVIIAQSENTEA